MRLPGPLIEYLINGAVAMIWLFPFIKEQIAYFDKALIILVPVIYVLGMFIDFVAFWITKRPKALVRKYAEKRVFKAKYTIADEERKMARIKVLLEAPELAKEIDMRSGRDRIARGMIVNAGLMFAIPEQIPIFVSLGLLVLALPMWFWFEYASHNFIIRALQLIKEKEQNSTETEG